MLRASGVWGERWVFACYHCCHLGTRPRIRLARSLSLSLLSSLLVLVVLLVLLDLLLLLRPRALCSSSSQQVLGWRCARPSA